MHKGVVESKFCINKAAADTFPPIQFDSATSSVYGQVPKFYFDNGSVWRVLNILARIGDNFRTTVPSLHHQTG